MTNLTLFNFDCFIIHFYIKYINYINIQFINTQKSNLELIIFNSIGETIYKESALNHTGEYRTSINLARYSNSIYFIQIKTDNGIIYKKIISQ